MLCLVGYNILQVCLVAVKNIMHMKDMCCLCWPQLTVIPWCECTPACLPVHSCLCSGTSFYIRVVAVCVAAMLVVLLADAALMIQW
jgi:hypothetical protein